MTGMLSALDKDKIAWMDGQKNLDTFRLYLP